MCVGAGSPIAVGLHIARGEPLCDVCASAERFRMFDRLELERFAPSSMTRRAFVAKVRREGDRLRREKAAAERRTA
jgi:hypothetical protein